MGLKGYIGKLKKSGKTNLEILEIFYNKKPFSSYEGVCIADYLNKKYSKNEKTYKR